MIQIKFGRKYKIIEKFLEFLKQSDEKIMTRDQWDNMIDVFEVYEQNKQYNVLGPCIILN